MVWFAVSEWYVVPVSIPLSLLALPSAVIFSISGLQARKHIHVLHLHTPKSLICTHSGEFIMDTRQVCSTDSVRSVPIAIYTTTDA